MAPVYDILSAGLVGKFGIANLIPGQRKKRA